MRDGVVVVSLFGVDTSSIPSPYSKSWLFNHIHLKLLDPIHLTDLSDTQKEQVLNRQFNIIDTLIPCIPPFEMSQVTSIDSTLETYFGMLVSAPTQKSSARAYTSFKHLLTRMRSDLKLHTLAKMMTTSCTSLTVASLDLLKHELLDRSQVRVILDLFSPLIFDTESKVYTSPSYPNCTISDVSLLYEKLDVVMHALNLHMYILLANAKDRNV
jgi:hypothetical protein